MPNKTLYESLEANANQFVEVLYQTPAQEYWFKAIATLNQFWAEFLRDTPNTQGQNGIFLTNSPLLISEQLSNNFWGDLSVQAWFFTAHQVLLLPSTFSFIHPVHIVTFNKSEAAQNELFLILVTKQFSALFLSNESKFLFSLHPEAVTIGLRALKNLISDQVQLTALNQKLNEFCLIVPSYKVISKFALALLSQSLSQELPIPEIKEVDTIKAIAHEVNTPLTTIRTLIRSLLRRQDITSQVRDRLEKIDFECQDQIERFNLIFEIVKTDQQAIPTEPTSLDQVLQNNLKIWQKRAQRRHLSLNVEILEFTPVIVSNIRLLSQLLNSVIDRLIRSLPTDSHISIRMAVVGKYIKLQFNSQTQLEGNALAHKAVGQWLLLQPDTGTLSLSLMISKALFGLIGGKLTIKTHPTLASYDGEILTIFLPIKD